MTMKMTEVRALAKHLNIKTSRRSKADVIKSIQRAENNFDCYLTAEDGFCDQFTCTWRSDCLNGSNKNNNRTKAVSC